MPGSLHQHERHPWQLGAWIVPSDPKATAPELAGHIERTKPTVGICSLDRKVIYDEGAAGGPEIVAVDEADPELGALVGAAVFW